MIRFSRAIVVLVAFLGANGWVTSVSAHPGSTSTVAINVHPGHTVNVVIQSDAHSLVAKLEALRDGPLVPEPASIAETEARLAALGGTLLDQIELRVDAAPVRPRISEISVNENGHATIELTGVVPAGAGAVTWSTAVVYGSYPLAVRVEGRPTVVRWLHGGETSEEFSLDDPRTGHGFGRGVLLGFTHILPHGIDHILFVVGLFLLSSRSRQLLIQVSAFTVAHSVTLGLSLYGVVSFPSRFVEPLIALSVAYVGVENLFTSRLRPWRVVMVFGFGLLHGLGFAEALAELSVSRQTLLWTLISFNVGVELGQLAVIAGAAVVFYVAFHARFTEWRRPIARFASAAVGVVGLVWTVERVLS